jgi:nucleotide-binding universal stress UspA family protein
MWTYPPHRILVAVDFGDASSRALRVAGDLARAFEASVTAVHAETFEAPPYFTREQLRVIEQQRKAARREAVQYLSRTAAQLAGMEVTPVVADAPPADAILEAAREHDLIVMGTHGRRGPARWWAGSVAERVARESKVPVLVVRAGANGAAHLFQSIAIIARGGTFDGPARRYARGLAARFKGEASQESSTSLREAAIEAATLVVLAQPSPGSSALAAGAVDRVLRSCRKPVLLVPAV